RLGAHDRLGRRHRRDHRLVRRQRRVVGAVARPGSGGRGHRLVEVSSRTVLITGAGGQVGREASALFESAGWNVVAHDRASLDITRREDVIAAVAAAAPESVVNLAAWNAVDLAETDVDGAYAVNAI